MNNNDKFCQDLTSLLARLTVGVEKDVARKLEQLKDWLINLQKENIVKINHSVMELVCAKYLIQKGYEVQIEYRLNDLLTCDLFSTKGYGNLIVEIETGFIPPEYALLPLTYTSARLASKIIRYGSFAGKFALGMPPHYVLPFPRTLAKPPRRRKTEEIDSILRLCNKFYLNPPVTEAEIRNARIQDILIIDVDQAKVEEMDPEAYMKRALSKGLVFDYIFT